MRDPIVIQGVAIPVPRSGELTDFITPDWYEVVQFYPEFCRRVLAKEDVREEPWDPQPYLLQFAKYLERRKAREGRTADDWMRRLMQHWGLGWLETAIADMKAAKTEAMEAKS